MIRIEIGAVPMSELQDFEVRRAGSIVTVKWRGSPSFTIGVWAIASDAEAFEQAAAAMDRGERQFRSRGNAVMCPRVAPAGAGCEPQVAGLPPLEKALLASANGAS